MPVDGVLEVTHGRVQGACLPLQNVWAFQGIPYAEPPVGTARFRKPKTCCAWSGTLDCTGAAENTRRTVMSAQAGGGSEDCLYLDVWMPRDALAARRKQNCAVMVILHPGAPLSGSKTDPQVDGCSYAAKGVIAVVPNFRLGLLGFLRFSDGDYNCILWDVLAALEWVSREIHVFGGSAENVTLCGVDGGADLAAYLLASPQSNRFFQRAILQGPGTPLPITPAQAEELSAEMKAVMGVAEAEKQTLRTLPTESFLRAQRDGWYCLSYCCPGTRQAEVSPPTPAPPGIPAMTASGLVIVPNSYKGVRKLPIVGDGELVKEGPLPALLNGGGRGISCVIGSARFRHQLEDGETPEISGLEELRNRLKWEFLGAPHATEETVGVLADMVIAVAREELLSDAHLLGARPADVRPDVLAQHLWDTIITDLRHGLGCKLLCAAAANDANMKSSALYGYVFMGHDGLRSSLEGEIALTHGRKKSRQAVPQARQEWMKVWCEFAQTGRCTGWVEYLPVRERVTLCDAVRGFTTAPRPREKLLTLLAAIYVNLWPVATKYTWDDEPVRNHPRLKERLPHLGPAI